MMHFLMTSKVIYTLGKNSIYWLVVFFPKLTESNLKVTKFTFAVIMDEPISCYLSTVHLCSSLCCCVVVTLTLLPVLFFTFRLLLRFLKAFFVSPCDTVSCQILIRKHQ